jgi:SAM-dependent methyltransferase
MPDNPLTQSRQPPRESPVGLSPGAEERIAARLRDLGAAVVPLVIDLPDYRRYHRDAEYASRYPHYYSNNLHEKSLEHYIAARLLSLGGQDHYVDIASEHSPVPEIYSRLFGCATYRQDLNFPPGLHGDTIGSDASDLPVPAGFATRMGLHCSFEHFEGDADQRFVREAARVLAPGGRVCIVPFYLSEEYAVQTDPQAAGATDVPFETDAILHLAPGWGNRHGRFYDPEHAVARVIGQASGLSATVFRLLNFADVDPSCYARFALVLAKPH